jgi:hypothetical protein
MLGDGGGDGLAADETGLDELVGVRPVDRRAGRTDSSAAVTARGVEDSIGQVKRRGRREHGPCAGVDMVELSAEPDRAGAFPGVQDVGKPAGVVRSGRAADRRGDVWSKGEDVAAVGDGLLGGGPHPRPGEPERAVGVEGEGQRLFALVPEALEKAGGKELVVCSASWSNEQWPLFGVEEFPDIEAVQRHAQMLIDLNWGRYIESRTTLGTEFTIPQ